MADTPRRRAARALSAYVPELTGGSVSELGSGSDNTAFLAGDLVLRVAEDGHSVLREARLLTMVAAHVSMPVPAVRFAAEDAGVLAYPLLPGRPLLGRPPPTGLARRLGHFLRELHAIDTASVDGLVPVDPTDPGEWLAELEGPPALLHLLHDSVPAPGRPLVLAHADLGAEHILEHHGEITGVIDWSDAAVTDPALDFARPYRDFGPDFLAQLLDAYGDLPDADIIGPRIEFFARCAALEDLTFGRGPGRHEYADAAERSLAWLFPS